MIVHIDYLECTCDMCGEVERIENITPTRCKPSGWSNIDLGYDGYLLCTKCVSSIRNFIRMSNKKEC